MNIISLFLWSQCTVFKLNNERLMMKKLTTVQRMTMPMTMRATAKVRQGSSKPVGWSVLATCLVSSTSFRWTRSWWRRRRRSWRRRRRMRRWGTEGAEVRGMVDNIINIIKGTTNPGVDCFNQINISTSCQRFDNCHKLSTALTAAASCCQLSTSLSSPLSAFASCWQL